MRSTSQPSCCRCGRGDLRHETEGVNYALDGTPIDILLSRCALPGHELDWERVLVSIVDISERKRADRAVASSNEYANGLFEHSPVSLWVEDYTGIKRLFAGLRAQGITDLARHLRAHPAFVHECIASIRVIDVNQRTLNLFRAPSKEALFARLDHVFGQEMSAHFAEELLDMWTGRMLYECEGINYTLTGEPIDIHLQRSVLPGHEDSWERVLISITDISARKKAEAYMKFLGTHDVLTGLNNRAFFDDAVQRLAAAGYAQTSIIIGT
jgi:PAS domain-containing protein